MHHPQTFHELAALDLAAREADRRRRPPAPPGTRRWGNRSRRDDAPTTRTPAGERTVPRPPRRAPIRPAGPAGDRP
jgi:hypothetical protein